MLRERRSRPPKLIMPARTAPVKIKDAQQVFEDVPEKRTAHAVARMVAGKGVPIKGGLSPMRIHVSFSPRVHAGSSRYRVHPAWTRGLNQVHNAVMLLAGRSITRWTSATPASARSVRHLAKGMSRCAKIAGSTWRIFESAATCEKCGKPIRETGSPCPYCRGEGVAHFERVLRLGVYEDPLKGLILRMKYHRWWYLSEFLADRLLDQERVKSLLQETDAIVAVPLFFTRHIARAYNQSDLIARRLAKRRGIRLVKALTARLRHRNANASFPNPARGKSSRSIWIDRPQTGQG